MSIENESQLDYLFRKIKEFGIADLFHILFPIFKGLKFKASQKQKAWNQFQKQVRGIKQGGGLVRKPFLLLKTMKALGISIEEMIQGRDLPKEISEYKLDVHIPGLTEIAKDIKTIKNEVHPKREVSIKDCLLIAEVRVLAMNRMFMNSIVLGSFGGFKNIPIYSRLFSSCYDHRQHWTIEGICVPDSFSYSKYKQVQDDLRNYWIPVFSDGINFMDKNAIYQFFFPRLVMQSKRFAAMVPIDEDNPILEIMILLGREFGLFTTASGQKYQVREVNFLALYLDLYVSVYFYCEFLIDLLVKHDNLEDPELVEQALSSLRLIRNIYGRGDLEGLHTLNLSNTKSLYLPMCILADLFELLGTLSQLLQFGRGKEEMDFFFGSSDNLHDIMFPKNKKIHTEAYQSLSNKENYCMGVFPYFTQGQFPKSRNTFLHSVISLDEETVEALEGKSEVFVDGVNMFFDSLNPGHPIYELEEDYSEDNGSSQDSSQIRRRPTVYLSELVDMEGKM